MYSVCDYNGIDRAQCLYQNPHNFTAQGVNLIVCKFKKSFRSWMSGWNVDCDKTFLKYMK